MHNVFYVFKQKLMQHYKKIVPALLCPVLFFRCSLSSYAYTSYDNFPYNIDYLEIYIGSQYNSISKTDDNKYFFDNPAVNSNIISIMTLYEYIFSIPVNIDVFDYYVVASVFASDVGDIDFTFFPQSMVVGYGGHLSGERIEFPISNVNFYHLDNDKYKGFSSSCKIDLSSSSTIGFIRFLNSSSLYFPENLICEFSVIALPKGLSSGDVNQAIVNAINNQTNSIMNAGSGFGGTTSGILSGNDELSGFIDDYTEVEQSMYDKFTENQSTVSGNFTGWAWGSLSTAVDWTSDYLNRIYDNSGDFRTMFMYPILAGIALIFIGRQGLTAYVRSRREK